MDRRQVLLAAGWVSTAGVAGVEAQGRKSTVADAPSLEEAPAEWLAFLGQSEGPFPESLEERTPTLFLYESGRLIWLSAPGTERASWRETTVSAEERGRLRGVVEKTGLLKLQPESTLPILRTAPTTHLGIRVGAGRRVLRVRGLDQLAGARNPDPLISAARQYRDALLSLRTGEGRSYEPGIIRVYLRPVGSRGAFPVWPVSAPKFSREGLAYYGTAEARELIGAVARNPRLRLGEVTYQVTWAPALQMPGEQPGAASGAPKPTDPLSAQIRWDGPQDKPMPSLWLFANRPAPPAPRQPGLAVGTVPGETLVALHAAANAVRQREAQAAGPAGPDGYTFGFEKAGKPLPGFRLSRSGSVEVLNRLNVALKGAGPDALNLQNHVQAAIRRVAS